MWRLLSTLSLGILLSLFVVPDAFAAKSASAKYYKIEKVYDGDTLRMDNGKKIRLIGIDCPESQHNQKLKKDSSRSRQNVDDMIKMGKEAAFFTKKLALGKRARLEYDARRKDKYGRDLAYVYLEDGTFLNAEIVRQGYASVLTVPPNVKHAEKFQQYYRQAREKKLGLWKKAKSETSSVTLKSRPPALRKELSSKSK